jgi:predicted phosphoadenosine phosphosulfate sulfurtransferase
MKVYGKTNVLEEARSRIKFLFQEFDEVIVGFSGGKDSTVILNLCLEEARRIGRIPLSVMFLDQEAEWQTVIDYVETVMYSKEVKPYWLQVPIKLFNATSHTSEWLHCWEEGGDWIREKDPISIKENVYGTDRFHEMFPAFLKHHFSGKKVCYVSGVRTEESPARFIGLTSKATYKQITWGKILNRGEEHFTFYPIYDWSYSDVWKAMFENKWRYCKIYDYMYQYGVPPRNMRVSNLHHETAIHALYYLQEIEPDTWNKLTARLEGINTTSKIDKADNFQVKELPFMFKDWQEYRDYLLDNLVLDPAIHKKFKDTFGQFDINYTGMDHIEDYHRVCITCILANDHFFTKLINFDRHPHVYNFRMFKGGKSYIAENDYYIPKGEK